MKSKLKSEMAGLLISLLMAAPSVSNGQNEEVLIKKYLTELPSAKVSNSLQKYRMTALYIDRDLYGNFIGKTKVCGDYTKGLENGTGKWNNVEIAGSKDFSGPFPDAAKQGYMEDMKYVPSPKMLSAKAFKDFPVNPESVYAKNLIWDMMAIEGFARDYADSLKLNQNFRIPVSGKFNIADIGTYDHAEIQLCRTGISVINDELCTIIEYRAIDNKIELSMPGFKSKGTEQYWGTVWVSLKTSSIESAVMFSGTIQQIEAAGMKDKFIVKTIRDLRVDKIQY